MSRRKWLTLAITAIPLFMVALGNLAVTTALPEIGRDLDATAQGIEWALVAYPLALGIFLLTAATLADRIGQRLMFVTGLAIFGVASAGAALSNSIEALDTARAVQGLGAAIVSAAALTLISDVFSRERLSSAFMVWASVTGLGVALGPAVGGAIHDGIAWEWIFWVNVPVAIVALALAFLHLPESRDPDADFDLFGLVLMGVALFGLAWGLIRGNDLGWTSNEILLSLGGGVLLLAAFLVWQFRARTPMFDRRFFRSRQFTATTAASLLMYFGLFGWLFLIVQFFEVVQDYSPLRAGLATLPATAIPIFIAPFARVLVDEIGDRLWLVLGLALQTIALGWMAWVVSPEMAYVDLATPVVVFGVGTALFFLAVASLVFGSVPQDVAGRALCAQTSVQALGGAFGIAALTAVLATYSSSETTDGLIRAMWITTAVVGGGTIFSLLIPRMKRKRIPEVVPEVVEPPGPSLLPVNGPEAEVVFQPESSDVALQPEETPEPEAYPCPVCMGQGWFPFEPPQDPRTTTCTRCYGHGKVLTGSHVVGHTIRDCPDCAGLGYVEVRAPYEPTPVTRGTPMESPAT